MDDLTRINNPFFRESLRPLKPTSQQLRDKRYKPTVEAIYLRRSTLSQANYPILPNEGKVQIPVIDGKAGDPNRHLPREIPEERVGDEFEEFRHFGELYVELTEKIQTIRQRSEAYPIWAADDPKIPPSLLHKLNDLNGQLFALKKCFVSPEEIMLDNTALIIQRFWRRKLKKERFQNAFKAVKSYRLRELTPVHRTLNSWTAQMEYADSRAHQFYMRGISKVCKVAAKFWLKWSERESVTTNRNEAKANDFFSKLADRHLKHSFISWDQTAKGKYSRKALAAWRTSMIPIMKHDLENAKQPIPQDYKELVISYVTYRSTKSFVFGFFLAWHSRCHSKSLRETVGERNAFLFYKKKETTRAFKIWLSDYRDTKTYLVTKMRWDRYIHLVRMQYSMKMGKARLLITRWNLFARGEGLVKKQLKMKKKKLSTAVFNGWKKILANHKEVKLQVILIWKRAIQDPNVVIFRQWNLYAVRRRSRKLVKEQLLQSHFEWWSREITEKYYWKWQNLASMRAFSRSDKEIEVKKRALEEAKHQTHLLTDTYTKEKGRISSLEEKLGDVTSQFVKSEERVAKLEDISVTWKVALHALKMELVRLALIVQQCSDPKERRRRFSDEDRRDRLANDDRYSQRTESKLSKLKASDRVVGKWKRRDSDPDLSDEAPLINVKAPLDENTIQLMSSVKEPS